MYAHLRNMHRAPEEDTLVLRASADVATIRREASPDLAGQVGVPPELAHQAQVPQVIEPDPAVIAGDEDLVLPRHGFYPRHLPALCILPPSRADMYGGVVLQLVSGEEYAPTIIRTNHSKLS